MDKINTAPLNVHIPVTRAYYIETYGSWPEAGANYRVHVETYDHDTLSPELVSIVRVVATSEYDAIARVLSGRFGTYIIGGPAPIPCPDCRKER